jgi:uncharacterized protein
VSSRLARIAVIGTAAGFFSGLFGVGGGTVMVPLLIVWLGYGEREATGTSLMAIILIAAAGTAFQALYGNVHPATSTHSRRSSSGCRRSPASSPGPRCSSASPSAPSPSRSVSCSSSRPCCWWSDVDAHEIVVAALLGVAGGVVGGVLGVGGGVIFVPTLALVLGLEQVDAEATSLLAVIAVGIVGAWRQHGYGNVRPRDGLLMGALSLLGVLGGVALSNALSEQVLRWLFAGVMIYFARSLFRRALRV